ncbi:MAG TPA: hypothetical protein VGN30_08775 [Steroidobacteraceae bacterium]|jgi:DNA-binding beta-propeller fold protein YncE
MKYGISMLLSAWTLALSSLSVAQDSSVLVLEATIPLPDVTGRLDHLSVDVKGERLFLAAVGKGTLEVIDLKTNRRIHTITDLAEPQGVFYEPSTNRLFVACGGNGATQIFDGTSFQAIATVKFPEDADNIRYDARGKHVIVGYAGAKELRKRMEGTGALGFLDLNGKKIGEVVIDAHPESFQLEKSGTRLFVNVPDKKEIEVVDLHKLTILDRWPVTSARENFPMTLDEAHHRLYVATRSPPRMLVFDTQTGKEVASVETSGGSDDLFYDAKSGRIYVLTSAESLDVFQHHDPDRYERMAQYPTPPHTQTGLFVPEWGRLFAASQSQGEHSAEIRIYQAH